MSECCPTCGQRLPDAPADPVSRLREAARERGHRVDPLGRVDERAAADLLGVTAGHLRNRRCYFVAVPHVRVGHRILYDLRELARLLEA